MDNKPYVFISYAHRDAAEVIPCVHAMRSKGINLWYDEGIEAGSEWPEFIAQKVVDCTKFVLFISKAYLESQNCKRELNFAISRKKDILSVYLEDVDLSPGVEMQLGTYQAIFKKRFNNNASFYDAMSVEHFFDKCRVSSAGSSSAQTHTTGTAQTGSSHTTSFTNGASQNTHTQGNAYTSGNSYSAQSSGTAAPGGASADQTNNFRMTGNRVNLSTFPKKSKLVTILLALFLGHIGIHQFYLGKPKIGILYIVLTVLTAIIYVPISIILSIIDVVVICTASKEKLLKKYGCEFV